jgi:uncharacterized protein YceK
MSWTAPMTATTGQILTASQWNVTVRDNLWETEPGEANATGHLIVTDGCNSVAERIINRDFINAAESTTSSTFGNLATWGPQVLVTTGTAAITFLEAKLWNNTTGCASVMTYDVWQGQAVSVTGDDPQGLQFRSTGPNDFARCSCVDFNNFTLNPGQNRFISRYRCSSNTANFDMRKIIVMPL